MLFFIPFLFPPFYLNIQHHDHSHHLIIIHCLLLSHLFLSPSSSSSSSSAPRHIIIIILVSLPHLLFYIHPVCSVWRVDLLVFFARQCRLIRCIFCWPESNLFKLSKVPTTKTNGDSYLFRENAI